LRLADQDRVRDVPDTRRALDVGFFPHAPGEEQMIEVVAERPSVGDRPALIPELAQHRASLTGHCRRILGSASDAEDAAQETLVRAWRAIDRFECRASSKTWMYRIATNVCLDILASRQRRAQPIDLRSGSPAGGLPWRAVHQTTADRHGRWDVVDPAELAIRRESIRLAFATALQHLPPRQRAVLILRDVLRWTAVDVAKRLGTTVAAVNGALQRARATLAARNRIAVTPARSAAGEDEDLLARYVDAFDQLDVERLVSLLQEDATR
jgi:RNA polymerase sigma-70 factor (ECF subfamily)